MRSVISKQHLFPKKVFLLLIVLALFSASSFGYYRYNRPIPLPSIEQTLKMPDDNKLPVAIEWPANVQASIGTTRDGVLASKPDQKPLPTASTAKLITVLTILQAKPLALGEQGPTLTIDQHDIQLYNNYLAVNGSLVAVRLGEQLTQYQMLQGILIRSGNNLADSLAIWAFGSLENYQKAAQKLVDGLGMTNTTIGSDASGFSSTTTSTAEDLTKLGIAAMQNEVVREIVREETSNLPVDGSKPNTNWSLGENGVIGIKTGSLPSIGGVFVIASEFTPEGEKPITFVGTIQGAPTTDAAIGEAIKLVEATKALFIKRVVVKKGSVVATISTAWGDKATVITADDISIFDWKYRAYTPKQTISNHLPVDKDSIVGHLTVDGQSSDLIVANTIRQPSWQWRLATSR